MFRSVLAAALILFSFSVRSQTDLTQYSTENKHLLKVIKHLQKEDTLKATTKLNKAVTKHPSISELYLFRAQLKIQRGDLEPAMIDLNSYCSLENPCDEAVYWKGLVNYQQSDFAGAANHFKAYKGKARKTDALVYQGLSYMWLYQYPHAEMAFDKAVELNPNSYSALYNGGLLAYRTKKYEKSTLYFNRLLADYSKDKDVLNALALSLTKEQKYEESNAILDQLLAIDKVNGSALYSKGVNYYHLNNSQKSCTYFLWAKQAGHPAADRAMKQYCSDEAGTNPKTSTGH